MAEQNPSNGQQEFSGRESGWRAAELLQLFQESLGNCPEFTTAIAKSYFSPSPERLIRFIRNGFAYEVGFEFKEAEEGALNPNRDACECFVITRHTPLGLISAEHSDPIKLDLVVSRNKSWGTILYTSGDEENDLPDNNLKPNTMATVEKAKTLLNDFQSNK